MSAKVEYEENENENEINCIRIDNVAPPAERTEYLNVGNQQKCSKSEQKREDEENNFTAPYGKALELAFDSFVGVFT